MRREGNHLRITAELTKVNDGFQLWSEEYNPEIKDIFAVQGIKSPALSLRRFHRSSCSPATEPPPFRSRRSPILMPTRLICKLRMP